MRTIQTLGSRRCLVIVGLLTALGVGQGQSGGSTAVTGAWPLADLARRLESLYAKPVTFEAPVQLWRGEMKSFGFARDGTEILSPMPHGILLPENSGIFNAAALSVDLIAKGITAYHQQNPDRSRYRVLESQMGFHIVPTHAHDQAGVLREVDSALDAPVDVLAEKRTASEHLTALLDAVSKYTGIPVRWGPGVNFDKAYVANGYLLPMSDAEIQRSYMLFEWGASEMTAREALIDLLENSGTTLTWELTCGPDFQRGNQPICNFTPNPLTVAGKQVSYDRCTKCRLMPAQGR